MAATAVKKRRGVSDAEKYKEIKNRFADLMDCEAVKIRDNKILRMSACVIEEAWWLCKEIDRLTSGLEDETSDN